MHVHKDNQCTHLIVLIDAYPFLEVYENSIRSILTLINTDRPLRCALIGYGAWGSHHARAMNETPDVHLTAVCSRSEKSRQTAATEHPGIKTYANYQDLLENEELDFVDIVLPSHLHFEVAKAVLESGRHLLLEKPMTLNVSHCRKLNELAQRRGLKLAVGHELRLSSLWGEVRSLIQSGAVGEPLYALIELFRRPYRLGSEGWRYDISRVGNWILEEPIHFFDLARWYFSGSGEPVSVYAAANSKQQGHPELQDNFSSILKFANGSYAVISQTLAGYEHHQTVKITGTQGSLWARWSGAMDRTFQPTFSLHLQEGENGVEVPIEKASGEVYELVDEIATFARAIRENTPPHCTGIDGQWSVAMCLAAHQSMQTGLPVNLFEFQKVDS
jgi:myo-inositol 2-dehydrogenase/D-chiro-inositol 1-dehydrogenase